MKADQYTTLVDSSIRRKVVEGTIPIIVRIPFKAEDKYTLYNASRNEYLPILLQSSIQDFLADVEQQPTALAFFINDQPIKWCWPIGVIFDALHNGSLPMEITLGVNVNDVKFQPYENEESIKNFHIQQLKESVYLRFKTIQPIRKLEVGLIPPLWEAHAQTKLEDYEKVYNPLVITDEDWDCVPIHWYFGNGRRYTDAILTLTEGKLTTVGDGVKIFFNEREIDQQQEKLVVLKDGKIEENKFVVIIQGVTVPLDTPLLWLALNMSGSDMFLHIVVRPADDLLITI
ncbi:hypothetical protein EIN_318600 [Entamoeba invadens IP1]|uniref:Autophagy protein 5 n=1 Tax=Entamoeba invadens IP1 TaxID=370355 RepID=A0A0A1U5F4_ENTIV|nr:hypothetical protein EIN_318600 [Entamoeba invadens IP1]ELP87001.1 hypothetical protein EIN_318600 [Entamoeba invadens IP1]|eukprot:XP_004253772.1 hypothetical protein EIN_318600 [Entamoeba invadens IP1]